MKYYYYKIFGLTIRSDFEFFSLPASASHDYDVCINKASIDFSVTPEEQAKFCYNDDFIMLAWHRVATFRIVGKDVIEVDPKPETDMELLALPLFGRVFASLLHRRGNLVLHASAVAMNGIGFALLGDKLAGKSTTASAFITSGYKLVSDDVVSLSFSSEGQVICKRAFAEVKLWDDASAQFELDATKSDHILDTTKRKQWLHSGFSEGPVSMKAVYILDRKDRTKIEILPSVEAFQSLLRFTYLADFGSNLFGPEITANHMKLCAEMAEALDVCRLTVPTGLDRLKETVNHVNEALFS